MMSASVGKQIGLTAVTKATILCVDKYPTLLPTVEALLKSFGYTVLTGCSVDEGLSHLSQDRVDAVILDYTLCGHDHHTKTCIVDRIHAVQPHAKIVVWCADDSVTKDNPPCADAVFIKPVDPQNLLRQLARLLGGAKAGAREENQARAES
jgi:DNA-binding NtrC family response regulator